MPKRNRPGIAQFLTVTCVLIVLGILPGILLASNSHTLGITDKSGKFDPKIRINKKGSSILVTKIHPREKFSSLKLRFIFPGVRRKNAMNGVYIQWGKGPDTLGRPLPIHKSKFFSRSNNVYATDWDASQAFRIYNDADNRSFKASPWYKVMQIRLDGHPATLGKSPISPTAKPPRRVSEAAKKPAHTTSRPPARKQSRTETLVLGQNKRTSQADAHPTRPISRITRAKPAPAPPTRTTASAVQNLKPIPSAPPAPNPEHGKLAALQKKYDALAGKYRELENKLADTERWYYFGPLLALIFSLLFTGASILASHILLSRGRRLRALSSRNAGSMTSHSQGRYRSAG